MPVEQQAQAVELHGGHGEDLEDAHQDCDEGEQPPAYVGLEFRKNQLLSYIYSPINSIFGTSGLFFLW